MKGVVAAVIDDIIKALTDPTEKRKSAVSRWNTIIQTKCSRANYFEANEKFQQYRQTDGRSGCHASDPEAVEWMLSGTTYPRDKVIRLMYPKDHTVEIAISAVMAGQSPNTSRSIAMIETSD